MKLVLISDIHARFLAPENRSDNSFFEDVVLNKLDQVFMIAQKHKCQAILQAGDLFDAPDPSRYVIGRLIRLFRGYNILMYSVLGQHDMIYRNWSNINRTATYLMESAGVVKIVGLDGPILPFDETEPDVAVHGLSFEQDFNLSSPIEGKLNILIAHASVGDKPLFPGHELPSPREFIKKHKGYDVILLGDYHFPFQDEFMKCQVFNTGVLVRKKTDEKEQKPNVIIYDTATRTAETVYLDFKPWPEVFHISEKTTAQDESKLQEFVDAIRGEKRTAVGFTQNLSIYYKKNEVSKGAKSRIAGAMERVGMSQKELKEVV